jgi:hypothetical protein
MALPGGAGFSSGSGPQAPWERIWHKRWYAAIDLLMEARRQLSLGGPFQSVERLLWDAAVAAASTLSASLFFSGAELAGKGTHAGVADVELTLAQFQSSSSASAGEHHEPDMLASPGPSFSPPPRPRSPTPPAPAPSIASPSRRRREHGRRRLRGR